jgi:hypothetical protein
MKLKFTASILSKGNSLFQPSITITDDGVLLKIPKFWKDQETHFSFSDITGIRLDIPSWFTVATYSSIGFNARGTWVEVHGFTKSDAQKIKRYIEDAQRFSNQGHTSISRSEDDYSHSRDNWQSKRLLRDEEFKLFMREEGKRYWKHAEEMIEKAKISLTNIIFKMKYYKSEKNYKKYEVSKELAREYRLVLKKYLRTNPLSDKEKFDVERYDEIIQECIEEAKSQWQEYLSKENTNDEEIDSWIDQIVKAYNKIEVYAIENNDNIIKNKEIIRTFIRNIHSEAGREGIYLDIEDFKEEEEDNTYIDNLRDLLDIIDKIYNSGLTELKNEFGKKKYPFALDYRSVQEYLSDKNNSYLNRISKIIDVTDNLVDRLEKRKEK